MSELQENTDNSIKSEKQEQNKRFNKETEIIEKNQKKSGAKEHNTCKSECQQQIQSRR